MKHKYLYITAFFTTALFTSCSDYLDELPDNRTELTTEESILKSWFPPIPQQRAVKSASYIVIILMKTAICILTFFA